MRAKRVTQLCIDIAKCTTQRIKFLLDQVLLLVDLH